MQDVITHESSPLRASLIFIGVFSVGLVIQMTLWMVFPIADENWWATDTAKMAAGTTLTPLDVTYVHPGTTIIYPMAELVRYGIDPKTSVHLVMAAFVAICAAFASVIAYRLRPENLWWLAVALILVPDLRLLHGTPPSTAAALLTVVFVLLFFHAASMRRSGSYQLSTYLGICLGLLLATRFDTGAFVLITALPFLVYVLRSRTFIVLLTTTFVFIASNPYVWVDPIAYLASIPKQMFANKALVGIHILVPFLITFPFAIFSIFVSSVAMYTQYVRPKVNEMRISFEIYLWFLGMTGLFTMLLAPLSFHPIRYFMPFYLTWDILLPLWLLIIARQHLPLRSLPWLTERRGEWVIIGLIILSIVIRFLIFLSADTREIIL